jgi:hypothetical protein
LARRLIPGPHYHASYSTVGVRHGSKAALAVARAIRELADADEIPAGDARGVAPVGDERGVGVWAEAWWITEAGVWLWFRADETSVTLVALSR